jgi:serine/threonine protein kinase
VGAGDVIGRYCLKEFLGSGGTAEVWRAIAAGPSGFSRSFVIKRILQHLAGDPAFVNMLVDEARVGARMQHPGIVQVHDLIEESGEYFLAMEWVEGTTLGAVLRDVTARRRELPAAVSCRMVSEVAAALAYAHTLTDEAGHPLGIVHRDVTPSNIMLTRLGAVKLLDFGIAKAVNAIRDERTRVGTLKGKLSYMSPEQAEGLPVDSRSDIFSLGIVFWECLTLTRLFKRPDDLSTLRAVRMAEVTPPSQLVASLDPEIESVVMRMLTRDPNDRFQTAEDVVVALRPILHGLQADSLAVRQFLGELEQTRDVSITVDDDEEPDEDTLRDARTIMAPEPSGIETAEVAGWNAKPRSDRLVRGLMIAVLVATAAVAAGAAIWLSTH